MGHSPFKFTQSLAALFGIPGREGERAEAYLFRVSQQTPSASMFPFDLAHLRIDYAELPIIGDFAFARHASPALDKVLDNYDDTAAVLMADSHRGLPDGFMIVRRCHLDRLSSAVASALKFLKTPRVATTGSRRQDTGLLGIYLTAFFK